jgi:hypothetical protein
MPIYFTCRICVKRHRPTPRTSTAASPGLRSPSLRYCLAAGEPAEDIADFLCRDVDEVRAKAAEIVE